MVALLSSMSFLVGFVFFLTSVDSRKGGVSGILRVWDVQVFLGYTLFWIGLETGFFFGLNDLDFDFVLTGWDFYANSFERTTLIYKG